MNIEMYRIFFEIQKKHWWFVTRKDIVIDHVNRYFSKDGAVKILDIGCGSGLMLNDLKNVGKTYGMDMSDEAIGFSKEIFDGKVEKGSLPDQLPFKAETFDLVTALDVIEHIEDDTGSVQAIHSLLAPGGMCVFTVPAYMFLWSGHDEVNEHKRRYTLPELKQKLAEAGFTVEKISYYNTFLFPLVYLTRMLNNLLGRSGASDTDMPGSAANYVLRGIFGIEKYLLRYIDFPFGVSILAVVRK